MQVTTTTGKPPPRPLRRVSGLRRWHRWFALPLLVFLLLAAVSGSVLVYKKELLRLVVAGGATLPADFDTAKMAQQLDALFVIAEQPSQGLIKAPNADEPYWTLTAPDGGVQLLSLDTLQPYQHNLWLVDTLAVLRDLHTALLVGTFGEFLLLLSGFGGLFLVVSGLLIWWPTRRSFRWRWVWPRPLPSQHLIHAHRHTGAASSLLLVVIIITGSLMLWQKLVRPILATDVPAPLSLSVDRDAPPSHWLLAAATAVPDGWPTYIRLADSQRPATSIRFRLPGEWHANGRTSVVFNTDTGSTTLSTRSDEASLPRRMVNQLYPLHAGYGMNGYYMALVFYSGVAMLWLGISGGVSYFRRKRL